MAAAAAGTQLLERARVPGKRKLQQRRHSSNPTDTKTTRPRRDLKSHKPVKKRRRQTREAAERDSDVEEGRGGAASSEEDGEAAEEEQDDAAEEGNSGSGSEEEVGEEGVQKEVTKFTYGCRAFKMAFTKIVKKSAQGDTLLGPMLSAYKKLVVKKLAEEEEEHKAKGEAKKERHMAAERGHVKPANFLDSKEKFLISVATKGVVKLFNKVNQALNHQRGPSRSKDAKELAKRRREAFLSETRKSTAGVNSNYSSFNPNEVPASAGNNNDEPGWAPLRDSYMLTSSKLKDWDKMENPSTSAGPDIIHSESLSDEE